MKQINNKIISILIILVINSSYSRTISSDLDFSEIEAIKFAKFAKYSECDNLTTNKSLYVSQKLYSNSTLINISNFNNSTNLSKIPLTNASMNSQLELDSIIKEISNKHIDKADSELNPCEISDSNYKLYFSYKMRRLSNYIYKFKIFYNDVEKSIVFSFSGPNIKNNKNINYIQRIYTSGWHINNEHKYKIENEFNIVYSNIRKVLLQKIFLLKKSGRENYLYYFTGFSLGSSIATLAAFDLSNLGLVSTINLPTVYTYGMMRIGDQNFIRLSDSKLYIYKINKINDFATRIPICYNENQINLDKWRCFNKIILKRHLLKNGFPFRDYITKYKWSWNSNNLTLHKYEDLLGLLNDLYYTQPIGKYILYNQDMTIYKYCPYKKDIPDCEKFIEVPSLFTIEAHNIYYNITFN